MQLYIKSITLNAHSCSLNVVVENEGEELSGVAGNFEGGARGLHLHVDGGDLEDEAATETGDGSGEEGAGVSGQGLNQLLHVAIGVHGSEEGDVVVGNAEDVTPHPGEIGLKQEVSDGLSRGDRLLDGVVALTGLVGGELKTIGESFGEVEGIGEDVNFGPVTNNLAIIDGVVRLEHAHTVLLTDVVHFDRGNLEVISDSLSSRATDVGLGGDGESSNQNN